MGASIFHVMCVQKERLHPTQHSHRVTKTTVTSQRNTWRCAARAPQPLSSGWVQFIAASWIDGHADALVHTEPAAHRLSIAFPFHRHHITLYTLHRTMHSQSSRQSAIHQDVHTSQSSGQSAIHQVFIPPTRDIRRWCSPFDELAGQIKVFNIHTVTINKSGR